MKKLYITFSGESYHEPTRRIVEDGPKLGADCIWVYDDIWLMKQDFYRLNHWLWDHPKTRGFGFLAWKPFIILHAMERLEPGDVVLYTDADTYPIADFSLLFAECERAGGVLLFQAQGCSNRRWVKRDCWIAMGQDGERWYDTQHACGRFCLFQKGSWTAHQLLMEWLTYSVNPFANTFDPSVIKPEIEGFYEHRTEQAILSLLAQRYGLRLYREACQFGDGHPEDQELYPTLFHQEWSGGCSQKPTIGSQFANVHS